MARTRVKICGITRVEDGLAAAEAGADAIGLVFYPRSSRWVEPTAAAAIVAALPPFVTTVGLFLDAEASFVREVMARAPLDLLQFHGAEAPGYCNSFGRPYIKAVPMAETDDVAGYVHRFGEARALLLDSHGGGRIGGTGKRFDWSLIPDVPDKPLILAGGLDPHNVAEAISRVRPYAVDVSSGVEAARGIKDPALIQAFMQTVTGTDPHA